MYQITTLIGNFVQEMHVTFLDPLTFEKAELRLRLFKSAVVSEWDVTLYGIPNTPK